MVVKRQVFRKPKGGDAPLWHLHFKTTRHFGGFSSHKSPRVRALIEHAGATLRFLPPDSPDFSPLENAFCKLKAMLRKAAERPVDALCTAIGRIIDRFPHADATTTSQLADTMQCDRKPL